MRPYFRMEMGCSTNGKLISIHPASRWVWLSMIDYSAIQESDGMVPVVQARRFAAAERELFPDVQPITDLLTAHLIEDCGEAYYVHDYLKHQKSHAQIDEERGANAERVARFRAKHRNGGSLTEDEDV